MKTRAISDTTIEKEYPGKGGWREMIVYYLTDLINFSGDIGKAGLVITLLTSTILTIFFGIYRFQDFKFFTNIAETDPRILNLLPFLSTLKVQNLVFLVLLIGLILIFIGIITTLTRELIKKFVKFFLSVLGEIISYFFSKFPTSQLLNILEKIRDQLLIGEKTSKREKDKETLKSWRADSTGDHYSHQFKKQFVKINLIKFNIKVLASKDNYWRAGFVIFTTEEERLNFHLFSNRIDEKGFRIVYNDNKGGNIYDKLYRLDNLNGINEFKISMDKRDEEDQFTFKINDEEVFRRKIELGGKQKCRLNIWSEGRPYKMEFTDIEID